MFSVAILCLTLLNGKVDMPIFGAGSRRICVSGKLRQHKRRLASHTDASHSAFFEIHGPQTYVVVRLHYSFAVVLVCVVCVFVNGALWYYTSARTVTVVNVIYQPVIYQNVEINISPMAVCCRRFSVRLDLYSH